jgi:hypothetical protein
MIALQLFIPPQRSALLAGNDNEVNVLVRVQPQAVMRIIFNLGIDCLPTFEFNTIRPVPAFQGRTIGLLL